MALGKKGIDTGLEYKGGGGKSPAANRKREVVVVVWQLVGSWKEQ
jgi:hypothetical protein